MCINPHVLRNGETVACRECWQCRENRINDWAGRCIAESKTALATYAVTLTYGENKVGEKMHERAAVLTYSDVQKYFKLLRSKGHKFKYFAVGEYGSKKGRAHWHLIMFCYRDTPEVELGKRFHEPNWPHGFSFWEKVTADEVSAVKYVCKYVQKDLNDALRQGHLAMSKKPPIGSNYFAGLAQRHVDAGISPRDLFYSFAGVKNSRGDKTVFMLPKQGRSAEMYIREFVERWQKQRPGTHWPQSDLVDWFQDKWVREAGEIQPRLDREWWRVPPPRSETPDGVNPFYDESLCMYVCEKDGHTLYWSPTGEWHPDNKTVMAWQRKDGMDQDAIRRRAAEIYSFMRQLRSGPAPD